MSKITRSDIYVRSEKGGEWFDDFLHSLAETKESSYQEIIDAISYKKSETVQGVVDKYREMVGLDTVASDADDNDIDKHASAELDEGFGAHLDQEKNMYRNEKAFLVMQRQGREFLLLLMI
jgi:hypothetical protein